MATDVRTFYSSVVGVTHRNPDGTQRQRVIERCVAGERLVLMREPGNRYSRSTIRVCRQDGEQLGYVPDDAAMALAEELDFGAEAWAEVSEVSGGTWDAKIRCVSMVVYHTVVEKPKTAKQVAREARKADLKLAEEYLEFIEAALMDGVVDEEEETTAKILGGALPEAMRRAVHAKVLRKVLGKTAHDWEVSDEECERITVARRFLWRLGWVP